ncbi:MAG: ribonuclease J [Desulfobacteraceae bacterium]|nr:MAG: ribonuclease J [Desulfobacteraceae bacterium]
MLKIIPLGGLGEIGLNMMVMEYEDTLFVIDAGLMFPEDYMLGVDIVIPDMEYIRENRDKVKGIILTHAHEDHIGALPYLLKSVPMPVYGTSFTLGIARNKLSELDFLPQVNLNLVNPGQTLKLGPFDIEFIRVSHSTIDGVGLAIRTPAGLVIHTGDFRISHSPDKMKATDISSFARYGEQGVLALLSDSTNAEVDGYTVSEEEVAKNLSKIIANSQGRVIEALFASNVHRIQQVIDIAVKKNRKVVFNGRSMEQIIAVATELGYITCPANTIVDVKDISKLADDRVVIITTGSQGEPMSSLVRMASGLHKQINIKKGDLVVLSSKRIPGNEKAIANIINRLYRRGAEVVYSKMAQIHASGHAHQEELKLMINLTKPEYFIPIHGEYRHLVVHARLAEKLGVPREKALVAEDGKVITYDGDVMEISGQVQTGRILVDGKGIGDVGRSVLKERRELSEGGLVIVTMIIDEETGVVLYGPELHSKGFVFDSATGYLIDDAQCVILEIVEEIEAGIENRVEKIRMKLSRALKQYFSFTIGRRPMIVPIILEV